MAVVPERESVVENEFDPSHRREWLGSEAHVRFRGNMADRRGLFRNRRGGFTGLAVSVAALAGGLVGAALVVLACRRRG